MRRHLHLRRDWIRGTIAAALVATTHVACMKQAVPYQRANTAPYEPGESRIIMPLSDHNLAEMAANLRHVRLLVTNGTTTLGPSDPVTITAIDRKSSQPAFRMTMAELAEVHKKTSCPEAAYRAEDAVNPVFMFCNNSLIPANIAAFILEKQDGTTKKISSSVVIDLDSQEGVATHALWFL